MAREALRRTEAEGLTLLRSESSSTGYKGVGFKSGRPKPCQAQLRRGDVQVSLGYFATAEEAALAYARTPEAQAAVAAAAAPVPSPMTAEEALRQAEADGLTLMKSASSNTGYKGVSFDRKVKAKPYLAYVRRGGKMASLGYFATAEEAALAYAHSAEAPPAPPQLMVAPPLTPAPSSRKRKVKSEEQPPPMPNDARVKLEFET